MDSKKPPAQLTYLLESHSEKSSLHSLDRQPSTSTLTSSTPNATLNFSSTLQPTQESTPPSSIPREPKEEEIPPPDDKDQDKSTVYDDRKVTMKDLEQCPLCFYIPNRAKLLTCCNDRLICSLCARSWLRKSDTCPFCRSYIPYTVRKHGLPDSDLQNVIDGLDVVCPYADGGCSWIGVRRDVKAHLKECVVAIDPETGHPAPGLLRISDFCLDEKWSNTPQRTTADAEASAASRSSFLPSDEMRSRRDSQFNDASSTRRLTAVSPARLEGGEIGESVGGRVRDWFVRGFRAFYVGFLVIVVVFVVGLLVAVYQNRMG